MVPPEAPSPRISRRLAAATAGGVDAAALGGRLAGGDARGRADAALDQLLVDGFAWADDQAPGGGRAFFFPSLWLDARQKAAEAAEH